MKSGVAAPVVKASSDVTDVVRQGDTVIYRMNVISKTQASDTEYPMHVISATEVARALNPVPQSGTPTTFVSYRGGKAWPIETTKPMLGFLPTISNDGRKAIEVRIADEAPGYWFHYDRSEQTEVNAANGGKTFFHYVLIDAEREHTEAVLDGPSGTATEVGFQRLRKMGPSFGFPVWSPDSRYVVIPDTTLPLASSEDPARVHMSYVVMYDAELRKWQVLEPLQSGKAPVRVVTQVGWIGREELLVRHEANDSATPGTVYTLHGKKWVAHEVPARVHLPEVTASESTGFPGGLSVTLKQSANDPPVVVASKGRREIALTPPDAALEGVWRARVDPFKWREAGGKEMVGGLLLPRGYSLPTSSAGMGSNPALPLVIQAYYYDPNAFEPDGPGRSAYAAQSLVAAGMAVLNINIPLDIGGTPKEVPEFIERVNSAADELAGRGLIDRARVGLVGFSRAGFLTYSAITHPRATPFAAVVVDDSWTGTYPLYLITASIQLNTAGDFERTHGGAFWRDKMRWLKQENTFNVDRVQSPALFAVHGEDKIPQIAADIGAFALNHRPLEYIVFPKAAHQMGQPRQRLASLEETTDWMGFWLQGKEPADSAKARRWKKMKADWERTLKAERKGS